MTKPGHRQRLEQRADDGFGDLQRRQLGLLDLDRQRFGRFGCTGAGLCAVGAVPVASTASASRSLGEALRLRAEAVSPWGARAASTRYCADIAEARARAERSLRVTIAPNAKIARKATSTVIATDVTRPARSRRNSRTAGISKKLSRIASARRNENLAGEIKRRNNHRDRDERSACRPRPREGSSLRPRPASGSGSAICVCLPAANSLCRKLSRVRMPGQGSGHLNTFARLSSRPGCRRCP